jgi:hypothetical protein
MSDKTYDWIVIHGQLVDTTAGGGGFEFYGPFSEEEALLVRNDIATRRPDVLTLALQLIARKPLLNNARLRAQVNEPT